MTRPHPRFTIGGPVESAEWWWLAAIVAVYGVLAVAVVEGGGPLGHDEAVYAVRARDFHLGVAPGPSWEDYRAPGLPWLLQFLWPIGSTAPYLRLVTAGFMVVLLVVTWIMGRTLFDRRVGLIAAAGLAATPFLVEASVQVWPDVPGAALGLGAIAVLVSSTGGERTSWWVLAVPILVAGSTYLRFGAPMQLLVGFLAVGVWRWRTIARAPAPAAVAAVLAAAAVWVILRVPAATGGAVAPLDSIGARRRQWFEGFADYAADGGRIVGTIAGFLLLAGLVRYVVSLAAGESPAAPGLVVLGGGAATFVVTALVLHGELRYLSPTMPWLWIGAAVGLAALVERFPTGAAPWLAAVLVVTLVVQGLREGDDVLEFNAEQFNAVVDAAQATGELAGDRSCGVVTGFVPQVAWYSGCRTDSYDLRQAVVPARLVAEADVVYLMWVQEGKRQPDPQLWQQYVAASRGLVYREDGARIVEVYLASTG